MNIPIAIAAVITGLAFIAHTFFGIREAFIIAPKKLAGENTITNFAKADLIWVQSLCAFQLVTVELLANTGLLFVLAFSDLIVQRQAFAIAIGVVYVLRAGIWLAQLAYLKRRGADYVALGQWMAFLGCGVLILWGACYL